MKILQVFLFVSVLFFVAAFSSTALGSSQGNLVDLSFEKGEGQTEIIHIQMSEAVMPKIMDLPGDTLRIVLDFYGVSQGRKVNGLKDTGGRLIRQVRVGHHSAPKQKTRVVLDVIGGDTITHVEKLDRETRTFSLTVMQKGTGSLQEPESPVMSQVAEKESDVAGKEQEPKEEKPITQLIGLTFEQHAGKGEMVFFELNTHALPEISGVEGDAPKIVCDFKDASMSDSVKQSIMVRGKYIHRIHVTKHDSPKKIHSVLELVPNKNYDLQQIFIKDENIFIIIINDADTDYTPFSVTEEKLKEKKNHG